MGPDRPGLDAASIEPAPTQPAPLAGRPITAAAPSLVEAIGAASRSRAFGRGIDSDGANRVRRSAVDRSSSSAIAESPRVQRSERAGPAQIEARDTVDGHSPRVRRRTSTAEGETIRRSPTRRPDGRIYDPDIPAWLIETGRSSDGAVHYRTESGVEFSYNERDHQYRVGGDVVVPADLRSPPTHGAIADVAGGMDGLVGETRRGRPVRERRGVVPARQNRFDRDPGGSAQSKRSRSRSPKRSNRAKPPTQKRVAEEMGRGLEQTGWEPATGHSGSGRWPATPSTQPPRSFDGQRRAQVLRHLSTACYFYLRNQRASEREVQSMWVNDRLLLSSNDAASMRLLAAASSEVISRVLFSADDASDPRSLRAINKLRALVFGDRIDRSGGAEEAELRTIAELLRRVSVEPGSSMSLCSPEEAARRISDDDYRNCVILVEGPGAAHAEQNLILAYCLSGSTALAHIYGKKRPCLLCWLSFQFARDVLGASGLVFDPHPGGFWEEGTKQGFQRLAAACNVSADLAARFLSTHVPPEAYRTRATGAEGAGGPTPRGTLAGLDTGYGSESESGEEDAEFADAPGLQPVGSTQASGGKRARNAKGPTRK